MRGAKREASCHRFNGRTVRSALNQKWWHVCNVTRNLLIPQPILNTLSPWNQVSCHARRGCGPRVRRFPPSSLIGRLDACHPSLSAGPCWQASSRPITLNECGRSSRSAALSLTNCPIYLASRYQAATRIPRISSRTSRRGGAGSEHIVRYVSRKASHSAGVSHALHDRLRRYREPHWAWVRCLFVRRPGGSSAQSG